MKWITRERPKIDRLACPWLIKRFVDSEAEFLFFPADEVISKSKQLKAIPFDLPDVEYSHYGSECTFDYILKKHSLSEPALKTMAVVVRGADTDRHDLAIQSAGLWAISAGLSQNITDDHKLLDQGFILYDALFTWARELQLVRHTQNPIDHIFADVYKKFLKEQPKKRIPSWAQELKEIIQDQIDTNLALSLTQISKMLDVHPAYLSREFSRYFDDMTFGDYIRKLRIEKAIELMKDTKRTLSEIAYLTGFSDQSHFNRNFKKHTGQIPSRYRSTLTKE